MKRRTRIALRTLAVIAVLFVGLLLLAAHPDAPGPLPNQFPHIAREPAPYRRPTTTRTTIAKSTKPQNPFEIDLRNCDLHTADLRYSSVDLAYAVFDTATLWPLAEKLPATFDPLIIIELGRIPA
jgi:hypothetical protein